MSWIIYLLIGFALGVEVGRLQAGRPFQRKKALIAVSVAIVVAVAVSLVWNLVF